MSFKDKIIENAKKTLEKNSEFLNKRILRFNLYDPINNFNQFNHKYETRITNIYFTKYYWFDKTTKRLAKYIKDKTKFNKINARLNSSINKHIVLVSEIKDGGKLIVPLTSKNDAWIPKNDPVSRYCISEENNQYLATDNILYMENISETLLEEIGLTKEKYDKISEMDFNKKITKIIEFKEKLINSIDELYKHCLNINKGNVTICDEWTIMHIQQIYLTHGDTISLILY